MSKHTPGPWEVTNDINVFSALGADSGDGHKAHSTDGWQVADCSEGLTFVDGGMVELGYDVKKANARLIAAAPDLLEALEYMLNCQYDYDPRRQADCDMCAKARAAISKARGES